MEGKDTLLAEAAQQEAREKAQKSLKDRSYEPVDSSVFVQPAQGKGDASEKKYNSKSEAMRQILAAKLYNLLGHTTPEIALEINDDAASLYTLHQRRDDDGKDVIFSSLDQGEKKNFHAINGDKYTKTDHLLIKFIDFIVGNTDSLSTENSALMDNTKYCRWSFDGAFNFTDHTIAQEKAKQIGKSIEEQLKGSNIHNIADQRRGFLTKLKTNEGEIARFVEVYAPKEEQLNLFLNIMTRRHYLLMEIDKNTVDNYTDKVNTACANFKISEAAYLERMQVFWASAFLSKVYYNTYIKNTMLFQHTGKVDGNIECFMDIIPEYTSIDGKYYGLKEGDAERKGEGNGQSPYVLFYKSALETMQKKIEDATGVNVAEKVEEFRRGGERTMYQMLINFDFYGIGQAMYNSIGSIISYITNAVSGWFDNGTHVIVVSDEAEKKVNRATGDKNQDKSSVAV